MTLLDKFLHINKAYDAKYNDVNPFRIATRLAEECGELAAQVNHFEDSGSKRLKHGEPNKEALALEVIDVIRCALHLATYYEAMDEVEAVTNKVMAKLRKQGWLKTYTGKELNAALEGLQPPDDEFVDDVNKTRAAINGYLSGGTTDDS